MAAAGSFLHCHMHLLCPEEVCLTFFCLFEHLHVAVFRFFSSIAGGVIVPWLRLGPFCIAICIFFVLKKCVLHFSVCSNICMLQFSGIELNSTIVPSQSLRPMECTRT